MGTYARSIIKGDIGKIITLLNKAFADEWLAYYQYWIGAKVVMGPMKDNIIAELVQHATDELRHADMLAKRILQLGGEPLIHPNKWFEMTNCKYEEPKDHFVYKILEQNINGEQCAIEVYNNILQLTKEPDPITYNVILQILADEVEHEEDLQSLKDDFDCLLKK